MRQEIIQERKKKEDKKIKENNVKNNDVRPKDYDKIRKEMLEKFNKSKLKD